MTGPGKITMSSVLGESGVIIGNLRGTGDFEVRGKVQGSIELSGRVLVAETGVVLGGIEATQIKVAGEVRGNLLAEDGVSVASSARVEGDVSAPRVGIEPGARVQGMLRTGGEPQSIESAKAAAAAEQQPSVQDQNVAPQPKPRPLEGKAPNRTTAATNENQRTSASLERATPLKTSEPPVKEPARTRKRKRPRPPVAVSSTSETNENSVSTKAPSAETTQHTKAKKPRGPNGPPKVPTFEKGAKGRTRQ